MTDWLIEPFLSQREAQEREEAEQVRLEQMRKEQEEEKEVRAIEIWKIPKKFNNEQKHCTLLKKKFCDFMQYSQFSFCWTVCCVSVFTDVNIYFCVCVGDGWDTNSPN